MTAACGPCDCADCKPPHPTRRFTLRRLPEGHGIRGPWLLSMGTHGRRQRWLMSHPTLESAIDFIRRHNQ